MERRHVPCPCRVGVSWVHQLAHLQTLLLACLPLTLKPQIHPRCPQLTPGKAPLAPALPPAHQVQQVQTGVLFRLMAPVIQAGGWAPAARPTPPDHTSPPSATAIFWQGRQHPGPSSLLPHHSQSIFLHCDTGLKPYHFPIVHPLSPTHLVLRGLPACLISASGHRPAELIQLLFSHPPMWKVGTSSPFYFF